MASGCPLTYTSLRTLILLVQGGEEQQQVMVREVFAAVSNRSDYACNFIEVSDDRMGGP